MGMSQQIHLPQGWAARQLSPENLLLSQTPLAFSWLPPRPLLSLCCLPHFLSTKPLNVGVPVDAIPGLGLWPHLPGELIGFHRCKWFRSRCSSHLCASSPRLPPSRFQALQSIPAGTLDSHTSHTCSSLVFPIQENDTTITGCPGGLP